jgi:addiction module HigA family antidote
MIKAFRDRRTALVFQGQKPKGFPSDVVRRARRKLLALDRATSLSELAAVPGNRLEALQRDRKGQHSIRINDQWRICFVWRERDADAVEITDYH